MKLISVVIPLMTMLISASTASYVFDWVDAPPTACLPKCPETHPACRRPALYDGPYVCFRDKISRNSGDWGESVKEDVSISSSLMTQFALSVAAGMVVAIVYAICYYGVKAIFKWKGKRAHCRFLRRMHRIPSATIQGVEAGQLEEEAIYAEVEEGGGAQVEMEMQDAPAGQQEVAVIEVRPTTTEESV